MIRFLELGVFGFFIGLTIGILLAGTSLMVSELEVKNSSPILIGNKVYKCKKLILE